MMFASPLWLSLLAPWLALAIYLLWGRRPRRDVAFLQLWTSSTAGKPLRRRTEPPPLALVCAMSAILLAILAAARPATERAARRAAIAVIVDRGLTGSARIGTTPRFMLAARRASSLIENRLGPGPVEVHIVPRRGAGDEPIHAETANWINSLHDAAPTAVDSIDELRSVARALLDKGFVAVVLLSDQNIGVSDERLVQAPPPRNVDDWGITQLAISDGVRPQAMATIERIGAPMARPTLRITSGGAAVAERVVTAPGAYFFDLPTRETWVEARLATADAQAADDARWAVRDAGWPKIEADPGVPAAVRRMIEIYQSARPPSESSHGLRIIVGAAEAASGQRAVTIGAADARNAASGSTFQIERHALTEDVDWRRVGDLSPPLGRAPAGWRRLMWNDAGDLLAVRQTPAPQVWVPWNDKTQWPTDPSFVVLWSAIFDWAGEANDQFSARTVGPHTGRAIAQRSIGDAVGPVPDAWPGLYRTEAGAQLEAFNAPPARYNAVTNDNNWPTPTRQNFAELPGAVTPWLLLGAMCMMIFAAAFWKRRSAGGV